jgi:tetratricopeptide (TPR) repeat protein
MTDRVRQRHVELEELAQLVEGTLEPERAAAVRAHVAGCPTCLAAYEEAVRDRATWLGAPDQFALPSEFKRAHAQVLGRVEDERATKAVRPIPISPIRTRTRWAWAAAATAAGLAAILWLGISPMSRRSERLALPTAIRVAAEQASAGGLVLPGGESGANATGTVYRSGGIADLGEVVSRAVDEYERDRTSSAALHAVCIGLVVSGRLDHAEDYIDAGLIRDPNDVVLELLAADVAYRKSKLEESERHLRSALRLRPRDPVATLDLGIVLAERGNEMDARKLFQSVVKSHRGTPLAARAQREIDGLLNADS